MTSDGLAVAAMVGSITAVTGAGLETMQDVNLAECFYWDEMIARAPSCPA